MALMHFGTEMNASDFGFRSRTPIVARWADRWFSRFLACIYRIPSAWQSLFIIFAPCCRCCLTNAARGRGRMDTWVNRGRAKRLRLQQLDLLRWGANWIQTTAAWHSCDLVIAHWMRCSITYEIRTCRGWGSIGALFRRF